jgi:hypothetical protein
VYDARGITDVSVAVPVAISVLRGACRSARSASLPWSLAWGQLPLGADWIEVVFRSGKLVERVSAVSIAGQFWAAEVPGRYRAVTVSAGLNRATARVLTVQELTTVRGMSWILRKEPFRELDQGRFQVRSVAGQLVNPQPGTAARCSPSRADSSGRVMARISPPAGKRQGSLGESAAPVPNAGLLFISSERVRVSPALSPFSARAAGP